LQRWYTKFPGGWPGVGLLVLRIAMGGELLVYGYVRLIGSNGPDPSITFLAMLAMGTGGCFVLGLLTPLVGGLSALIETVVYLWHPAWAASFPGVATFDVIAWAVAIALLGPGALSLDAYIFGRRKVVIARVVRS
jgi:uncharacterized membrane protein YphA (DoxX/SURF4 family)